MAKTNVKFVIVCSECKKENRGKPISLGYITQCKCGHTFTKQEIENAIEEVRALRKVEKQD